ncbi:MAG: heavy-metal-associated domain-containing protein [Prolixibacteraceae bacterium]
MKKTIQLIVICFIAVLFASELKAQEPKNDLVTVCYRTTMDCNDCQVTLTNYLKFEKGVKDLKVDLKSNTIKVVYKSEKNSPENLAKGIKKLGYEANPITEKEYKTLVVESPGK